MYRPTRLIALLLSVLWILVFVIGGCVAPAPAPAAEAGATPAASEEGAAPTVSLWTEFTAGGEATGMTALIDTWNAKGGSQIEHRPIGNEEFFTVIRTGLAGGEPPDILQYEGYQQTRDFAAEDQLTDITDWWKEHKDRFDLGDAGEYACTFEGKVYCLPYTFTSGWQIYYNPQILKDNGIEVPTTMEEFLAAAETLKAAGITPIALGDKDGWPGEHWWMAFLVQRCGVEQIYQAVRMEGAKFTDECFVQAAADFQNLAKSGYLSAGAASDDYGTAQAVFLSGQSAFFQTGGWFASGWEQQPPPFEVGILPFPRFEGTEHTGDITGAVTHVFGIPSAAKNKEAALEILDWLTTDEAAQMWAANGNGAMVNGAVDSSAPQVIKDMWGQVKSATNSLPWIENELPPGVGEDKIYNGTVALITGEMTPEQFTESIQAALEAAKAQ